MTKEEIFNNVQDIFRDIFDEDGLVLSISTNSESIEDWDSLNHINLISAIEKNFNIKFSLGEMLLFKNVGDMIELIEKKINKK